MLVGIFSIRAFLFLWFLRQCTFIDLVIGPMPPPVESDSGRQVRQLVANGRGVCSLLLQRPSMTVCGRIGFVCSQGLVFFAFGLGVGHSLGGLDSLWSRVPFGRPACPAGLSSCTDRASCSWPFDALSIDDAQGQLWPPNMGRSAYRLCNLIFSSCF